MQVRPLVDRKTRCAIATNELEKGIVDLIIAGASLLVVQRRFRKAHQMRLSLRCGVLAKAATSILGLVSVAGEPKLAFGPDTKIDDMVEEMRELFGIETSRNHGVA